MAFVTFFGKTLVVAAIVFQAWLLYQDKREGDQFHKNLTEAIANCSCLNEIRPYLFQYLRLAVVGLLASSVLLLVTRCWSFKLLPLIGLSVLLWVEHHGVFRTIPTIALLDNSPFWHSLGVIGAIIYLMGAQCTSCKKPAEKESTETRRTESTSQGESKPRPKKN